MQVRRLLLDLIAALQAQDFRSAPAARHTAPRFVANINFKGTLDSFFFEARRSLSFGLAAPEAMFAVSARGVQGTGAPAGQPQPERPSAGGGGAAGGAAPGAARLGRTPGRWRGWCSRRGPGAYRPSGPTTGGRGGRGSGKVKVSGKIFPTIKSVHENA